jgi:hypothetical protein
MAKKIENIVVVKISQLVRDDQDKTSVIDSGFTTSLQDVVEQLVGNGALVEIEVVE